MTKNYKSKNYKKGLSKPAIKEVKKEIKNALKEVQEMKHTWFQPLFKQGIFNVWDSRPGSLQGCYAVLTDLGLPGDQYYEREGQQILLKNLEVNYTINSSADGTLLSADEYNNVRVVIFQWHADTLKDRPFAGAIFDLDSLTPEHQYLASYSTVNKDKFTILYDKNHLVFNTPVYSGGSPVVHFEEGVDSVVTRFLDIPLKYARKHINYVDTDNSTDHIYVTAISDSTASPGPTISLVYALNFTDS